MDDRTRELAAAVRLALAMFDLGEISATGRQYERVAGRVFRDLASILAEMDPPPPTPPPPDDDIDGAKLQITLVNREARPMDETTPTDPPTTLPPGPWATYREGDDIRGIDDATGKPVLIVKNEREVWIDEAARRAILALPTLAAAARLVVRHGRTGGDPWSSIARLARVLDAIDGESPMMTPED